MTERRIGIMTGGGDCPGLNAVIRAVFKYGEARGFRVFGVEDAFHGLVDLGYRSPRGNRWLDASDVHGIVSRGGTILGTSNRADPFRFPVRRDGTTVESDLSAQVMEHFREIGLECLVSIGGDGSMRIAHRMSALGMPVVGVPKTIDNDLAATDQTFGFDTAVQIATEALDRIRDTAESHDRVMLVELMGRDAGFIALAAGIAAGAHAILLPEIPYRVEPVLRRIRDRRDRGCPYTVIVVAEGAVPSGRDVDAIEAAPGAMRRLVGAASRLEAALREAGEEDVRTTVLGHIQRGGSPTAFDRVLATRFGHHAAELVDRREYGRMVALRSGEIVSVPLSDAALHERRVGKDASLLATARAMGTVFGDE